MDKIIFHEYRNTFSVKELNINVYDFLESIKQVDMPEYFVSSANDLFETLNSYNSIEGGYVIISDMKKNPDKYTIMLNEQTLNISDKIFRQMKLSDSIAVFLCTAGQHITDLSKEAMKNGDMIKGYIADMFGSFIVEKAMDKIHDDIEQQCMKSGMKVTNRFSPGYCGWNVSEQKKIFSFFPENFCNVKLTDSCLMVPIKSISGIIGIGAKVNRNVYQCDICNDKACVYRKKAKE